MTPLLSGRLSCANTTKVVSFHSVPRAIARVNFGPTQCRTKMYCMQLHSVVQGYVLPVVTLTQSPAIVTRLSYDINFIV